MRLIVANPVMIDAYKPGVPGNGEPFPEGSKTAKIEWRPKKITDPPFSASIPDTVPGELFAVEFIEKDSERFSDTHAWGYASKPPQGHGAKCGAACHNLAASKNYIFTPFAKR
jgi:hypothetical protein